MSQSLTRVVKAVLHVEERGRSSEECSSEDSSESEEGEDA